MESTKQKRRYTKSPNWKPRPSCERKVKVYGYVKRQHFATVQAMITELIQPYR